MCYSCIAIITMVIKREAAPSRDNQNPNYTWQSKILIFIFHVDEKQISHSKKYLKKRNETDNSN